MHFCKPWSDHLEGFADYLVTAVRSETVLGLCEEEE